jgi:hypothetical protein
LIPMGIFTLAIATKSPTRWIEFSGSLKMAKIGSF